MKPGGTLLMFMSMASFGTRDVERSGSATAVLELCHLEVHINLGSSKNFIHHS
jgi:hypothetical protein